MKKTTMPDIYERSPDSRQLRPAVSVLAIAP
jgi:hypothetical protein